MDFSTEGFKREEKVSAFVKPGVVELQITDIEAFESAGKGTPGIRFTFEGQPQAGLNDKGATMTVDYYMSEKAWPYTKGSLCDIADALGVRNALNTASEGVTNHEEYAKKIYDVFTGKFARYLVTGEEIQGAENVWVKAGLPLYPKVESMEIPADQTKLSFSEDKHITKLVTPDPEDMTQANVSEGMPF